MAASSQSAPAAENNLQKTNTSSPKDAPHEEDADSKRAARGQDLQSPSASVPAVSSTARGGASGYENGYYSEDVEDAEEEFAYWVNPQTDDNKLSNSKAGRTAISAPGSRRLYAKDEAPVSAESTWTANTSFGQNTGRGRKKGVSPVKRTNRLSHSSTTFQDEESLQGQQRLHSLSLIHI